MSYPPMQVWVRPLEANVLPCDCCMAQAVVEMGADPNTWEGWQTLCGACLSEALRGKVAITDRDMAHAQTQREEGAR